MTAEEHVRSGRLADALAELQSEVKKRPGDARLRIFLFQLLAVMGQLDRALTQLEVAGELDPGALSMTQTYRDVLRCERTRRDVFAGRTQPLVLGEPAEWTALLILAIKAHAERRFDDARSLRRRAFDDAPATPGAIDGRAFEWIADADPRLGPMLEAIVNGRYYWIPFARLTAIEIEKPLDLRDIAWMPVTLTFANGGQSVGFVPTRYPDSEASADPQVVMARSTEWLQAFEDVHVGLGQRLLATDQEDVPFMDARLVRLGGSESASSESVG
jgi:type VI secretion system protein ImpE